MGSLLGHAAFVKHIDEVGHAHAGEAMGYQDDGSAGE